MSNSIKDKTSIAYAQEIACYGEEQHAQIEESLAQIGDAFLRADPVRRNISFCLGSSCLSSGASVRFFHYVLTSLFTGLVFKQVVVFPPPI